MLCRGPLLLYATLPVFRKHHDRRTSRWCKCRLICHGAYTEYKDLPENLLEAHEKIEVESHYSDSESTDLRRIGALKYLGFTRVTDSDMSCWRPYPSDMTIDEYRLWFRLFDDSTHDWIKDYNKLDELFKDVRPFPDWDSIPQGCPHRPDWVVCNWSKEEYVRAQAVAKLCKQPEATHPYLRFKSASSISSSLGFAGPPIPR